MELNLLFKEDKATNLKDCYLTVPQELVEVVKKKVEELGYNVIAWTQWKHPGRYTFLFGESSVSIKRYTPPSGTKITVEKLFSLDASDFMAESTPYFYSDQLGNLEIVERWSSVRGRYLQVRGTNLEFTLGGLEKFEKLYKHGFTSVAVSDGDNAYRLHTDDLMILYHHYVEGE